MSRSDPCSSTLPLNLQLREARRRAGLTQAALAEQAGCMQSAVSMMEGGRWSALARPTLEKIANVLGVALPEEDPAASNVPACDADAAKLCPNAECPSNLPYLAGGDLLFLPRGMAGEGRYCPLCGEVLASKCGTCGARIVPFAACCSHCGNPLVAPPPEPLPDLRAWVAERQRQAQLLSAWPLDGRRA